MTMEITIALPDLATVSLLTIRITEQSVHLHLQSGHWNAFGIFDVGNSAKPAFADIDDDGDYDLYMGEAGFRIVFLRNSSSSNPNFTYISDNPAGISGLGSNVALF